ncbi:MAG: 2-C-methyl-D-erythritol 4-phosphate cytidylyltransferase [Candidatus Caldatribacteriaceae bacterium]
MATPRFFVIVVAAGVGERMNLTVPKQYVKILGKPILAHTLEIFETCPEIEEVIPVINVLHEELFVQQVWKKYSYKKVKRYVFGGRHRQESVYKGLLGLQGFSEDFVLIHDGVRPLLDLLTLQRCVEGLRKYEAICCAVPCMDTLKLTEDGVVIRETLDRKKIWRAQTPQGFRIGLLWEALKQAEKDDFWGTDDASLVERLGHSVHLVVGSEENLKITTPQDLVFAEEWLRWRKS